jgi:GntR family transcriptional regulator/MocR family aminotransferase
MVAIATINDFLEANMSGLFVALDGDAPLHRQLYDAIRAGVLGGTLPRGARLPATRRLAQDLGVSRTVVVTAYDQLAAEGFLEARTGSGTYVAPALAPRGKRPADGEPASVSPAWSRAGRRILEVVPAAEEGNGPDGSPRWNLAVGALRPGEFGDRRWRRALAENAAGDGYGLAAGAPELRRAIARYLAGSRGVDCSWEDVVIVQGTRQALDLLSRLLIDPEDVVALEEPHYPDAQKVFRARGARLVAVPVDGAGVRVDALPDAPVRLAYVTPSHQYPTGAVLSIERRHALLEWAARNDAIILEDDYDSEFRYEGRPVPALRGLDRDGRVAYIGSFSKVLSPDLRLGYVAAAPPLARALARAKRIADRQSPFFLQRTVATYMDEGHFSRHIWRMRRRYGRRREAVVRCLGEALPAPAEVVSGPAGIQLLLRFPDVPAGRAAELAAAFLAAGVRVDSAAGCYLGQATCAEFVIGFARHEPNEIASAARVLGAVVKRFRAVA